jgi:enoyl-[acyl-carrier-protein] reductase (NADH)
LALVSFDEARWITGEVIYADGGAWLMNAGVPPEVQLG